MISIRSRFLVGLGVAALAGCTSETTTSHASVKYEFVAPYCSGPFPVSLLIDSMQVAIDTFNVSQNVMRTTSATFPVASGTHTIGGRVVGVYSFPDRSVTLAPDSVFVDSLSFYCS